MLILVLNLPHRTDRQQAVQQQLDQFGLAAVFVEAINGRQQAALPPARDILQRTTLNPGEVGCYLSHIKAWQTLLASDQADAVILEDDALLSPAFMVARKPCALTHLICTS